MPKLWTVTKFPGHRGAVAQSVERPSKVPVWSNSTTLTQVRILRVTILIRRGMGIIKIIATLSARQKLRSERFGKNNSGTNSPKSRNCRHFRNRAGHRWRNVDRKFRKTRRASPTSRRTSTFWRRPLDAGARFWRRRRTARTWGTRLASRLLRDLPRPRMEDSR